MKINFTDYKIQKRTVKAGLKKLGLEEMFSDNNTYRLDKIKPLIEYFVKEGSDSVKLSVTMLVGDIQKWKVEEEKRQIEIEERRSQSKHEIKNTKYVVKEEIIEIANKAIYDNVITKEHEEIYGYSRIAKDFAVKYAVERKKVSPRTSIVDNIQKVLKMYKNVIKNMANDETSFEIIAGRYVFPESVELVGVVKRIMDEESIIS